MRRLFLTAACVAALIASGLALADSYSGTLTWAATDIHIQADGPGTTTDWDSINTWLKYTVETDGMYNLGGNNYVNWKYTYQWNAPVKDLSHLIIEVSDPKLDIRDVTGGNWELGTWSPSDGNSNVGMPEAMFGLKLTPPGGLTSATFSFETTRGPVWGDFYARDGRMRQQGPWVYAYNKGFTSPDSDPSVALWSLNTDPSTIDHILRPDTQTVVPDGGTTVALLGLALAGVSFLARRRG